MALWQQYPGVLAEPCRLARFLGGLVLPKLSRARLSRHSLFGARSQVSLQGVLQQAERLPAQRRGGSLVHGGENLLQARERRGGWPTLVTQAGGSSNSRITKPLCSMSGWHQSTGPPHPAKTAALSPGTIVCFVLRSPNRDTGDQQPHKRKATRRVQTPQTEGHDTQPAWRRWLWLSAMATLLWAAKYHPFLASPRVFDDDARQHVYWTYRFQDSALFRDDPLTALFASPQVAPIGYQALYALGTRVLDPLLFSQLLSLGWMLLSVWLIIKITQRLSCPQGSGLASGLFLLYFLYSSSGGLPKSLAFPLLLGSLYAMLCGTFRGMAALLVAQSVLYPPILCNTMALAAVMWLRAWWDRTEARVWPHLVVLGAGAVLAAGILGSVYMVMPGPSLGKMVTRSEARAMPEFGPQGRTAFYGATLWQTLSNDRAGIGADRLSGFLIIIAVMYGISYPHRLIVPEIVWHLVWTSGLLFGLAHAVLFKLHLPSRYVLYTLLLAALLVIAANRQAAATALARRLPGLVQGVQWWRQRRAVCWGSLGIAACLFVYVQNRYIVYVDPLTVRVDATALQLYGYLQTLPKDALIAGHPLEMDNVPLLARRRVLANQELSIPYYTGYYAAVRQRLVDSLAAYYSADPGQVTEFARRYGVDYIVVNRHHFAPSFLKGRLYYEPFHSLIAPRLVGQNRFALLDGDVGESVYVQGPYIVVSLGGAQKG